MTPSNEIYEFIATYEQLHDGDLSKIGLQPKLDAAGIWTEGYGHAMVDEKGNFRRFKDYPTLKSVLPFAQVKSEKQARALLIWDVDAKAEGVNRRLERKVNQHQYDALVSHAYNCGYSQTLYRLVNEYAHETEIKYWFTKKYVTAGGVYMRGLQYRRNDEYEIWLGKNYKREYNISI